VRIKVTTTVRKCFNKTPFRGRPQKRKKLFFSKGWRGPECISQQKAEQTTHNTGGGGEVDKQHIFFFFFVFFFTLSAFALFPLLSVSLSVVEMREECLLHFWLLCFEKLLLFSQLLLVFFLCSVEVGWAQKQSTPEQQRRRHKKVRARAYTKKVNVRRE
jgi:hypothetical protein